MRITLVRHPDYTDNEFDYFKWRLCYKGGRYFKERFLERFSAREGVDDFKRRKAITYSPSYAKIGIDKLKNTLFSRMCEISRLGGPANYQQACLGEGAGVDLYGSSMNRFLGECILPELMTMRKVGVYVDKQNLEGNILANNLDKRPYLYYYRAEDILTWDFIYTEGEYVYYNVLLREKQYVYDSQYGNLVTGTRDVYRHMWLDEDGVHIQFWIPNTDDKAEADLPLGEEIVLPLKRLPFVMFGLRESLLQDVADYQIALLNIASSDLNYVLHANFPFYVEQFDPVSENVYARRPAPQVVDPNNPNKPNNPALDGNADQQGGPTKEVRVGTLKGRQYPKGTEVPSFIAPPVEPLLASMKKQDQMKDEIFELIDIAASKAQPQHASAESKSMDDRGLESGLSMIGMELEHGERQIAKIWGEYESLAPATVIYPEKYTLKNDQQRVDEAKALQEVKVAAPSKTFSKEVSKRISHVMLDGKVTPEVLTKIDKEIDNAEYTTSDPTVIQIAAENGMVDAVTGANALGFNGEKIVPIAKKEHADKLATIAEHQSKPNMAARGVPDQGGDPKVEKKPSTP